MKTPRSQDRNDQLSKRGQLDGRRFTTRVLIVIASTMLTVGAAYSGLAFSKGAARNKKVITPMSNAGPGVAAAAAAPDRMEVERIKIGPGGFEPDEITRPAGPFLLALDNSDVLGEAALSLVSTRGSKLKDEKLSRGNGKWRQVLNLQPGEYILTDAKRPGKACRITIQ